MIEQRSSGAVGAIGGNKLWAGAGRESSLMAYCGMAVGRVFKNNLLKDIAARNGRTVAQVVLRWWIQQPRVVALSRHCLHPNLSF